MGWAERLSKVSISSFEDNSMMRVGSVVRGLALVCLAVAVGWWLRGAGRTVLADSSSRGSDAGLEFQMTGAGPQAALTVYNPGNRTLYLYQRIGEGNSHISCAFSFTVSSPGGPIERKNCGVGELLAPR
jgi:hypothetical protein